MKYVTLITKQLRNSNFTLFTSKLPFIKPLLVITKIRCHNVLNTLHYKTVSRLFPLFFLEGTFYLGRAKGPLELKDGLVFKNEIFASITFFPLILVNTFILWCKSDASASAMYLHLVSTTGLDCHSKNSKCEIQSIIVIKNSFWKQAVSFN